MGFDREKIAQSFGYEPQQLEELQRRWRKLMGDAVWLDLKCSKIGALSRLRKRILEVGEGMRSFVADRSWIPQPREQLKSAIASSLNLRDTLQALDKAAEALDAGDDFALFSSELSEFHRLLLEIMEKHESQWATLLEQGAYVYDDDEDDG